ncbi:MAG: glycosyltransferase [Candidatus Woesearchaeota archaeon]
MKILLALRGSNLYTKPYCFFKKVYNGIPVDLLYAGAFGLYWEKALKQMGHKVETVLISKAYLEIEHSRAAPILGALKRRLPIVNHFSERIIGARLLQKIKRFKPDFILVDSGDSISPNTLNIIKKQIKIPIVNWLLDDPIHHQNWKNVIDSFPLYDCIFVFDPYYIPEFIKLGAKRVEYLPLACDIDIHRDTGHNLGKKRDLCFVGTITPRRAEILSYLSNLDLNIWTWNPKSLPKPLDEPEYYKGKVWGEEISRIYNSSKIVINIHHPQSVFGTNLKTFEIASSCAFQLVDFKKELENLFKIGEELICYNNVKELIELIKYYLNQPEKRREIALKAQKRVQSEHTYIHRFTRMLSIIGEI